MYDMLIVGAGPAGISAALTAQHRGRGVLVLGNDYREDPLAKAPLVTNYPGLSGSGLELLAAMRRQLDELGIPVVTKRVLQAMAMGDHFACSAGMDFYEGRALLLCTGLPRRRALPGEREYLGRGLSYCATCDGMLYRGKDVLILGEGGEAVEDAAFLAGIGCRVRFFGRGDRPEDLLGDIPYQRGRRFRIIGENGCAAGLEVDGTAYPAAGIFLLRPTVAADRLFQGLETLDGHITVDRAMATNVPGVFAAGDCVGKPYQLAKATGEGNVAALSADKWLKTGT